MSSCGVTDAFISVMDSSAPCAPFEEGVPFELEVFSMETHLQPRSVMPGKENTGTLASNTYRSEAFPLSGSPSRKLRSRCTPPSHAQVAHHETSPLLADLSDFAGLRDRGVVDEAEAKPGLPGSS